MMRLLEKTDTPPLQNLLHGLEYGKASDPDAVLRCAACLQIITSCKYRIEVQGASEHIYSNPHGYRFHIICFREAAGCLNEGEPTSAHSWFRGYNWCYALCGSCRTHLGWHYAGGDGRFYGLIRDRLVEGPSNQAHN